MTQPCARVPSSRRPLAYPPDPFAPACAAGPSHLVSFTVTVECADGLGFVTAAGPTPAVGTGDADSAAAVAGIEAGDRIVQVNGAVIREMTSSDAVRTIKQHIERSSSGALNFVVVRRVEGEPPGVASFTLDGIEFTVVDEHPDGEGEGEGDGPVDGPGGSGNARMSGQLGAGPEDDEAEGTAAAWGGDGGVVLPPPREYPWAAAGEGSGDDLAAIERRQAELRE